MRQPELLRHQAFFDRLASLQEHDPNWAPLSAGLLVLRQLDDRLRDGLPPDARASAATLDAAREVPATDTTRRLLIGIAELAVQPEPSRHVLGVQLFAWARALENNAAWALAQDVYRAVTEFVPADDDLELVTDAWMRRAYVARMMAAYADAEFAIERGREFAARLGDASRLLRLRMASANVAVDRHQPELAEHIIAETVALAAPLGGPVYSEALHGRGNVARMRGDDVAAMQYFHRALEGAPSDIGRERLLLTISAVSIDMGARSMARDALLVLAVTAQTRNTRWLAVVNLLEIAVLDRNEISFESYRRELAAEELSPIAAGYFALYEGHGHRVFGRPDLAAASYARALKNAHDHQLGKLMVEADAALAALREADELPGLEAEVPVPSALEPLARRVRAMRESVSGVR
jgi:tetratricopeptide (TPR) repeat protein